MKLLVLLLMPFLAIGQFKNDNVLYKTIDWEQFCKQYYRETNALLLDVRSQGEYDDTSASSGLNIGRLKGATHINITELGSRLNEIAAYKDKPVYLYCSHSQRSRRCSKLLYDSGFTNIINVNGGLTDLYLADPSKIPCRNALLQTNNTYKKYNPQQVYKLVESTPALMIVDVRTDSAFKGTSATEKDKALGRLKGAINIPLSNLAVSLDQMPKDKTILLVDAYGDDANKAAALLTSKGYSNVITSFDGLDAWLTLNNEQQKEIGDLIERKISYQLLDAATFNTIAKDPNTTIVDVRPAEEFQNQSPESWRNRGRIKGAVNIPLKDLGNKYGSLHTNNTIILNGFGNSPEAYEAAALLSRHDFKKVYVLTTGVWGLRYKAFNSSNSMYLNDWVVDVPEANR